MVASSLRRTLVGAAVCLVTATGCSSESASPGSDTATPASSRSADATSEPSTQAASPSASATPEPTTPTPTPSASPSQTASPTETGSPEPDASAPAFAGLRGRLLAGAEVPGFNDSYRWRQVATGPERPEQAVGTCQRFAVTSIGAERAEVRRFRPVDPRAAGTDRAAELVAQFPDELTARRAFAVLEAWRRDCRDRLTDHRRVRLGGLQPVAVPTGRAQWYLLTYGPVRGDPSSQFFDAQGMALVGTRIAMVSIRLAGQDYNYEPGSEPMVEAVRRAAQRLS